MFSSKNVLFKKNQVTDLQLVVRLMVSFLNNAAFSNSFLQAGPLCFSNSFLLAGPLCFSNSFLLAGPLWKHVGHHHLSLSLQADGQRHPY